MNPIKRIAVIGGGPGGLAVVRALESQCGALCQIDLFEAQSRTGGKVLTGRFGRSGPLYEAGLAELYDYSHLGPDPLKDMVTAFGLQTVGMGGDATILGDAIIRTDNELERLFGRRTRDAADAFYDACTALYTPQDYYERCWLDENQHPWSQRSFRDILNDVPDDVARRYIEVSVRSDLATEASKTSGLNGLQNYLTGEPDYVRLYSIVGGIDRLTDKMRESLRSRVHTGARVRRITAHDDGGYRIDVEGPRGHTPYECDIAIIAMPIGDLERISFSGSRLERAMRRHVRYYDHPGHYLRVSVHFPDAFWRTRVGGTYFMSDAFGGCCLYDESRRHASETGAVLGWLMGGVDAERLSRLDDETLVRRAIDSLPRPLAARASKPLDARVHRWVNCISGQPGGIEVKTLAERHMPDAIGNPDLLVVGDYLFDATLNGALQSADYVSGRIATRLIQERHVRMTNESEAGSGTYVPASYHDHYAGERSYEQAMSEYFDEFWVIDNIWAIWNEEPPYRLLDCGSANGLTLPRFRRRGVTAWGVENSPYIHGKTPEKWRRYNKLGDVRALPFEDNFFDFVYDTSLCYLPPDDLTAAISELHRVCRTGVILGGITSDARPSALERSDVLKNVRSLMTLPEWAERMQLGGFKVATANKVNLRRAWKVETVDNHPGPTWYPDVRRLRLCFYTKLPLAPPSVTASRRNTGMGEAIGND
jgi:monoamine oxidase/SAM-dependent methyltransferase